MPESLRRLPTTNVAIAYADWRHAGQLREVDGDPFLVHPLEVACLLHVCGAPDHVIAAGLLHDEHLGAELETTAQRRPLIGMARGAV